eukprot:2982400-Rhodomonas_salina.1
MAHKAAAKAILYDDEVVQCLRGGSTTDPTTGLSTVGLSNAIEALHNLLIFRVWMKMLFRYEGINKNIDANFMRDYNETTSLGLGKSRED